MVGRARSSSSKDISCRLQPCHEDLPALPFSQSSSLLQSTIDSDSSPDSVPLEHRPTPNLSHCKPGHVSRGFHPDESRELNSNSHTLRNRSGDDLVTCSKACDSPQDTWREVEKTAIRDLRVGGISEPELSIKKDAEERLTADRLEQTDVEHCPMSPCKTPLHEVGNGENDRDEVWVEVEAKSGAPQSSTGAVLQNGPRVQRKQRRLKISPEAVAAYLEMKERRGRKRSREERLLPVLVQSGASAKSAGENRVVLKAPRKFIAYSPVPVWKPVEGGRLKFILEADEYQFKWKQMKREHNYFAFASVAAQPPLRPRAIPFIRNSLRR